MTYPMTVAGLRRDLPICKVTEDLYIGAFIPPVRCEEVFHRTKGS